MQFFVYDFALALVALLGYRIVLDEPLAMMPAPRPAADAQCGQRAVTHRLINFW